MTAHSMRFADHARPVRTAKRSLRWSCAAAAIAITAGTHAQTARAQAFQGNPSQPNPNIAVDGSATRTITGGTSETITVSSPKATINWTPTDTSGSGPIDFLPEGNVATFTNGASTPDFTVLNRILPSQIRPIALNGTVISQLQSVSGTATGGHVWFYSPNGIIVGAKAVFNVGGLLLTVNDPVSFDQTATGFTGHFTAAANSTAAVVINPGANISAGAGNSYVALVAPRVVQGGTVNVNGSAAYVAGEDVTLTMNQGLFDIQVDVGTSDPYNPDGNNGIVHTGTTGGPASTGAGDNQKIYMVAVPKNQALIMLLAGNAGFTPAGAAQVVNGEIVLSAGWNIHDASGTRSVSSPVFSDASIQIDPGTYTSNVFGIARGDINALADTGPITFLGNLNFNTYDAANTGNVTLGAVAGQSLTVAGSVLMNSSNPTNFSQVRVYADTLGVVDIANGLTIAAGAGPGRGGNATISADDGTVLIGGSTTVTVDGQYFSPADAGLEQFAQYAQGGSITVSAANGGHIHTNSVTLSANATGQSSIGGDAGAGYGGYINIDAQTGGDIQVAGALFASAIGTGGNIFNGTFGSGTYAGYGGGGSIYMNVGDGTIAVTGDVNFNANAVGGSVGDSGSGATQYGGTGSGGTASVSSNGPGSITVGGVTTLAANGTGGNGQTGGSGYGGNARIYAYDGLIDLGATNLVFARGTGGNANIGFGGAGGFGGGGSASIEALANTGTAPTAGTITADAGGNTTIDAGGQGGTGGAGNATIAAGAGGNGRGGTQCFGECNNGGAYALAQVDGAVLTLGNVEARAQGFGGAGGTGGPGQPGGTGGIGYGGFTQAGLIDNSFRPTGATTGRASFGNLKLDSSGFGGVGGVSPFQQGDGGAGFGGDALFQSFASDATAGSIRILAGGHGGDGGLIGGDATGGTVTISTDGGHIDIANTLNALTDSFAGAANAPAGTGGLGSGGTVDLTVNGGRISFTGGSIASRGNGGPGYTAGEGDGGTVNVSITNLGGVLTMNGVVRIAAFGGGDLGANVPGGTGGTGGDGYGGDINVSIAPNLVPNATAAFNFGNLTIRAAGAGGNGGDGLNGGDGGYGEGGTIAFLLGAGATLNGNRLNLNTDGAGGSGGDGSASQGDGGDGHGGSTDVTIDGIATIGGTDAGVDGFIVTAFGEGGDGRTGGSGTGGTASLTVGGTLTTGALYVAANAAGGLGSAAAGNATAGTASFTVNGGSATITSAGEIRADASGEGTRSGGLVTLAALNGGTITARDLLLSSYGNLNVPTIGGAITVSGKLDLESESNIVFGDANVGVLEFNAGGTVTGGNIIALNKVTGDAEGAVVLGNIRVTGPELPGDFSVGIASKTSIRVGNVSATNRIGFATLGDLTTGNIAAGSLFMTLASGNVRVGSITTAPTGQVYMADSSMFLAAGGPDDFDSSLVLALPPVATAGSITVTGPISTGLLRAAAGTDLTTGAIGASAGIDVSAGHDITLGGISSGGTVRATAGHDLRTANITSLGHVNLNAVNNLVFANINADLLEFDAGGSATGGNIVANTEVSGQTNGQITLGNITVGPGLPPAGDLSVGLSSPAGITVGNVQGTDRIAFVTQGNLTAGNIQGGSLVAALVHGNVRTGSVATAANGRIYIADSSMFTNAGGQFGPNQDNKIDGAAILALSPVVTGGSILLTGPVSTGQFQAAAGTDFGAGPITAGSSIDASAVRDLATGNLTAGTTVGLTAGNDLSTANIGFGQSVTLNAGNTIAAGNLTGGHNVTFTAGNNLSVRDVRADGTATFTAAGLASFLGVVGVPTITVTSSDIDVPFGGSLGVRGITNLLTLNAVSSNPIVIGHSGALGAAAAAAHYVLDEAGDIIADTLVINAVGANGGPDPDILVHNIEIAGSAAPQPELNHVVVNTDASVLVDGLVLFTGAGDTDSLAVNAGSSIQVNTTAGGRIAMTNAAEDRPSGVLSLTSDHIWVGSQSLLDQLNANPNFAGRDALVGINPGAEVPEGFLIASGVNLTVSNSLFVQNSGVGRNYAGITVGAGGLKIATTGTTPAQVVAYGRKMNPDGTYVTGNRFFKLVDFTKATSLYTAKSEFNECLINTGCLVFGSELGPESILGPVDLMGNPQETIDWAASGDQNQPGGVGGQDGSASGSSDFSSQLFSTAGLGDDALIDEGVTSGGDDNQWDSQLCKPDSSDQPCPVPPADKQEQ